MGKQWQDVRDEIMQECDRIWYSIPDYVRISNNNYFPSGAGVGNMVMGNRYMLTYWMHITSYGTLQPTVMKAIASPDFTLDQCKKLFKYLIRMPAQMLGGTDGQEGSYPWLNMELYKKFYDDIVDSFDSIKTKEELKYITWLFCGMYARRLNTYFQDAFPWTYGPKKFDMDTLKTAARLLGAEVVEKK